jgi:hypothetical protein
MGNFADLSFPASRMCQTKPVGKRRIFIAAQI